LDQARRLDDARRESGPMAALIEATLRGGRPLTHPLPVLRAREMRRWVESEQFHQILDDRGAPLEPAESTVTA